MAAKGDLVLVRRIGDGSISYRREPLLRWYVGRVTKTRNGLVTEFEYPGIGGMVRQALGGSWGPWGSLPTPGTIVGDQKLVDVDRALEAAAAHHYPGHPRQAMPFDGYEEAVATCVAPFRKEG